MKSITIYTTPVCPYCVRAKSLLQRHGLPYQEIDVAGDPEKRAWLIQVTGRRTVPQIFIGDHLIGGCDDLHAADKSGELRRLLQENSAEPC